MRALWSVEYRIGNGKPKAWGFGCTRQTRREACLYAAFLTRNGYEYRITKWVKA